MGLETQQELLVVELRRPHDATEAEICARLSEAMPEGMEVIGFAPSSSFKLPRVISVTYRTGFGAGAGARVGRTEMGPTSDGSHDESIPFKNSHLDGVAGLPQDLREALAPEKLAAAVQRYAEGILNDSVLVRDKQVNLGEWVEAVWLDQGEMWARIKAHDSGAGISPYVVYGQLLNVDSERLRSAPLIKQGFAVEGDSIGMGLPQRVELAESSNRKATPQFQSRGR